MNANALSGSLFISRDFLILQAPCCQSRALPALCFICGEQSDYGWALTSGVCNSTCEEQPGLSWAHLSKRKKGHFPLHLNFHCAASFVSHLIFGHKPHCATTPMFLPHFSHREVMGSATKSLLPGSLLGELDNTFSSLVMPFSCGFPPFHLLVSLICCCLSASVCPQWPCSILLFWVSLAVSYFTFN